MYSRSRAITDGSAKVCAGGLKRIFILSNLGLYSSNTMIMYKHHYNIGIMSSTDQVRRYNSFRVRQSLALTCQKCHF